MILAKAFILAMLAGIATPFAISGLLQIFDKILKRGKK